jgi:hypothetical protein
MSTKLTWQSLDLFSDLAKILPRCPISWNKSKGILEHGTSKKHLILWNVVLGMFVVSPVGLGTSTVLLIITYNNECKRLEEVGMTRFSFELGVSTIAFLGFLQGICVAVVIKIYGKEIVAGGNGLKEFESTFILPKKSKYKL